MKKNLFEDYLPPNEFENLKRVGCNNQRALHGMQKVQCPPIIALSLLAEVEVPSSLPLEEMARKLSAIIGGFTFEPEETGRFEEVPAFFAKDDSSGVTFILFGIPEGEICDAYTLECSAETELFIPDFSRSLLGFMSNIVVEKNINARGYFDYSDELAAALTANGINATKSAP
ncbi:MAG: hypothetical protein ACI802_001514 [Candidatus Paceibacteria bacterium]|jgi:hypothetical protein